jgi:hypothetical protein
MVAVTKKCAKSDSEIFIKMELPAFQHQLAAEKV